MTKTKIALLGSALCAALTFGAAKAQDVYTDTTTSYLQVASDDAYMREYERATGRDRNLDPNVEQVIVHPYYDEIYKEQVLGRADGSVNATAYTASRPVSFSDLNLGNPADRAELRIRIHETAADLCAQLDDRVPQLRGDREADKRCIREAARRAMREVYG